MIIIFMKYHTLSRSMEAYNCSALGIHTSNVAVVASTDGKFWLVEPHEMVASK